MAEYPLLIFPSPSRAERSRRWGGGGRIRRPDPGRQADRIAPRFTRLQEAMDRRRIELQNNPIGIQPEQTLVLETVGSIDNFINAIRWIEGLEWLGESEIEGIEPDYGFEDETNPERQLRGQLFLVMTDQQALSQIQSLFDIWRENPEARFPHGLARLKAAFEHLHDIRPWGPGDRIQETGLLEDWQIRMENFEREIPFEAELWFRSNPERRRQAESELRGIIESLDGEIVQQCAIPDIAYHAILGRIPDIRVREMLTQIEESPQNVRLLRSEGIMHIRPVGQCAILMPEDTSFDTDTPEDSEPQDSPIGDPVVALFDGMPLTGHLRLDSRLIVDDPDGYESDYQARERFHGTTMASLICHGDLNEQGDPVTRQVYARPIMKPIPTLRGQPGESIPQDVLPVDLIHRAVRRLYESENSEPPAAPGIRVINLSIGDHARPFDTDMSPLARLLDWLAWKYKVLFIVSAGNHLRDIELDMPMSDFASLTPEAREKTFMRFIAADSRHRRLLSPAETLNGLTLGASHMDSASPSPNPYHIDPLVNPELPSVITAHGPGYRRSIKPDLLMQGGRQILSERLGGVQSKTAFEIRSYPSPPGQRVAVPGPTGQLNRTSHTRGTSNAAALASHSAHFLYDVIERLRVESGANLPEDYDAVLMKTLLVHGTSWENILPLYESVLRTSNNGRTFKDYIGRFIGYGLPDLQRVVVCTDQRVTLLGVGQLGDGDGDEFALPLPPSLSAVTDKRRLTVTLAWLTPVNSASQNYRVAHLWFDPRQEIRIAPNRQYADHRAVQRGTVQHEVLEGHQAVPFQDEDNIVIKVNCRSDAGDITQPIHYGLAVTLEVAETLDLPIYQEVRDRIGIRIPV